MLSFRDKKHYAFPANPQGMSTVPIPQGGYCDNCPYAGWNPLKGPHKNGYCRLLNFGDWMDPGGLSLLWDGIKMCHIKTEREIRTPGDSRVVKMLSRFYHRRKFTAVWGRTELLYARDAAWRPSRGMRAGWKKRSFWQR